VFFHFWKLDREIFKAEKFKKTLMKYLPNLEDYEEFVTYEKDRMRIEGYYSKKPRCEKCGDKNPKTLMINSSVFKNPQGMEYNFPRLIAIEKVIYRHIVENNSQKGYKILCYSCLFYP